MKSTGLPQIPQTVCVASIFFLFTAYCLLWALICWSGLFPRVMLFASYVASMWFKRVLIGLMSTYHAPHNINNLVSILFLVVHSYDVIAIIFMVVWSKSLCHCDNLLSLLHTKRKALYLPSFDYYFMIPYYHMSSSHTYAVDIHLYIYLDFNTR